MAETAWQTLKDLSEGKPIIPVLPDGRVGEPMIPPLSLRMKASVEILDRLYGKPMTATERQASQAKLESQTLPIDDLSDAEIVEQVKGALHALQSPADGPASGDGE
jgi:hypothetical protein